MSEETRENTDNKLIRRDDHAVAAAAVAKEPTLYDAEARNRFAFTVRDGSKRYETAHVFEPLGDDRYMKWLRGFKLKGTEQNVSEESREATARLWDDQIFAVEKIKFPEGADWKTLIPGGEKVEAMNSFLAVAIAEDIELVSDEREIGAGSTTTIRTEAYFNGDIVYQAHELRKPDFELEKKYSRIRQKQFKQEPTRGLRRQPKIEYVPQDDKFGELYDEMLVRTEGFTNDVIPLRFKTTVIDQIFGEKLDQKKSEE
jgi:hypothetical protein